MKQYESIVKVQFREPPLAEAPNKTQFFFGSLAAIYETFTAEQIGCKVETLWNANITECQPYRNKICEVSRDVVTRKAQKLPSRNRNSERQ